jgi:hypothetical protein
MHLVPNSSDDERVAFDVDRSEFSVREFVEATQG